MGPTQSKLFNKIPVAAGISAELKALSDAAIAGLDIVTPVVQPVVDETEDAGDTAPETQTAPETAPTATEIAAMYDTALLKVGAQAVSVYRSLAVTAEAVTKAALIDAIVADGGDGVLTSAEEAAIAQYDVYLAQDVAALQAEADSRNITYDVAVDDTVGEMARLLLSNDTF